MALIWSLGVVAVLWMPPPETSTTEVPGLDLVLHFTFFFGLGVLWRRAGLGPITVIVGAGVLAIVTELTQGFLPWPRTPSGLDAAADLLGAVAGVATWHRFARARARPEA